MAGHLDDRARPGRRSPRRRARRTRMASRGKAATRLGPVDAEDVGPGEDQQARRAARPKRSRPGWRNGRAARSPARSTCACADASGAITYWNAWRTISGMVEILRAISNRPGRGRAARARQHQVEHHRRRVDQQPAGQGRRAARRGRSSAAAATRAGRSARVAAAAAGRNSGRAGAGRARRSARASRDAPPSARCCAARARRRPTANRMRAICSQKMRSRISGPNARRARAAEVATSTKVHRGSAQTKMRHRARQVRRDPRARPRRARRCCRR